MASSDKFGGSRYLSSKSARSTRNHGNVSQNGFYKEIFVHLDKLVASFVSNENIQNDLKENITKYLTSCSYSFKSSQVLSEEVVVSKISSQIGKISSNTEEIEKIFFKVYEQMLSSYSDERKRCALLTFLYKMSIASLSNPNSILKDSSVSRYKSGRSYMDTLPANEAIFLKSKNKTNCNSANYETFNSVNSQNPHSMVASTSKNKVEEVTKSMSLKNSGLCTSNDMTPTSQPSLLLQTHKSDLVQSLIYSFAGVQSKHLRKDVVTGRFKLDLKIKTLNEIQAGNLLRIADLGFYHDKLQEFTDMKRGCCISGVMGQAFVAALKHELTRFYGLVALLQEQFNRQNDEPRHSVPYNLKPDMQSIARQQLTPLKVQIWSIEPALRLQELVIITDACQELKGGALASKVYGFLNHGKPEINALARSLLKSICGPLYKMLVNWLLSGEINDPKNEFFIECLNEVTQDRLWHDKYRVRVAMLPCFISHEMANKILVIGKSINFLNELCGDKEPAKYKTELQNCIKEHPEYIFSVVADTKLHEVIDKMYLHTSKRVLDVVVGSHKLLEHLQAMRRYLLLGQGDFISLLMSNLKSELDKPARELYSYDLSSIMDSAIRCTNAQYEDPEILNHLDVRLVAPCDGDIGWDILSLQYTVTGPLATMLEPSMSIYQLLFKPLWRMKHMEFILTAKIWKDQKYRSRVS